MHDFELLCFRINVLVRQTSMLCHQRRKDCHMIRTALIAALVVIPTVAMADKIVGPDGDSFTETRDAAGAGGFFEAINPVTSAEAATLAPTLSSRQSADVPLMASPADDILRHQFDGYYIGVPGQN
jgi:hypothetical protein